MFEDTTNTTVIECVLMFCWTGRACLGILLVDKFPTKVILDGLKRNMSQGNSLSDELDLSSVLGDTRTSRFSVAIQSRKLTRVRDIIAGQRHDLQAYSSINTSRSGTDCRVLWSIASLFQGTVMELISVCTCVCSSSRGPPLGPIECGAVFPL